MSKSNIIGKNGEIFTENYLIKKGFKICANNYRSRYGEIDIICEDAKYIIFVEVKSRSYGTWYRGLESVTRNKKIKIIKTAFIYLMNNPSNKQPRFDIAELTIDKNGVVQTINYFENAFNLEESNAFF